MSKVVFLLSFIIIIILCFQLMYINSNESLISIELIHNIYFIMKGIYFILFFE